MAALTRIAVAIALVTATPTHADRVARWQPYIAEASTRFGVPAAWIEHVMRAESAGMTMLNGRPIRSRAGAMGLMQLMPVTWMELRARLALGTNPDDPRDNILAGTFFLRLMYDRFGYPGLFGAYNAGPGRYAAYLAGRQSLPGETIAYLDAVVGRAAPASAAPPVSPLPTLFAVRRDMPSDAKPTANATAQPSLFVVRSVVP
jgi:soluble lytic murein transglycosylase-like protein